MKRIVNACLMQTIHFELPEEFENFKKDLDRKNTKYLIDKTQQQTDGSLTVELRKQYNTYDCGTYMN